MNLVLHFHDIDNLEWFEKTVIHLKKKFEMINIHQLDSFYQGDVELFQTCHITIDDGDISFYNIIFPILRKHNIPATLFVSPLICRDSSNFWFQELYDLDKDILIKQIENLNIVPDDSIKDMSDVLYTLKCLPIKDILNIIRNVKSQNSPDSKPRNINLSQLLEIADNDLIEIGAHTLNHPILFNEDDQTSKYEISESIILLESLLGRKIKYFAYPNGYPNIDFSAREIVFLERNGINLAFSTEPKVLSKKDNPMSVPRLSISYGNITFLNIKLFLFRYWNIISILWYPSLKRRKKFIELTNRQILRKK
jgi:peptidoglycan/xylan/chitin deacetylase (PgdA/CDA1 family)